MEQPPKKAAIEMMTPKNSNKLIKKKVSIQNYMVNLVASPSPTSQYSERIRSKC